MITFAGQPVSFQKIAAPSAPPTKKAPVTPKFQGEAEQQRGKDILDSFMKDDTGKAVDSLAAVARQSGKDMVEIILPTRKAGKKENVWELPHFKTSESESKSNPVYKPFHKLLAQIFSQLQKNNPDYANDLKVIRPHIEQTLVNSGRYDKHGEPVEATGA